MLPGVYLVLRAVCVCKVGLPLHAPSPAADLSAGGTLFDPPGSLPGMVSLWYCLLLPSGYAVVSGPPRGAVARNLLVCSYCAWSCCRAPMRLPACVTSGFACVTWGFACVTAGPSLVLRIILLVLRSKARPLPQPSHGVLQHAHAPQRYGVTQAKHQVTQAHH